MIILLWLAGLAVSFRAELAAAWCWFAGPPRYDCGCRVGRLHNCPSGMLVAALRESLHEQGWR